MISQIKLYRAFVPNVIIYVSYDLVLWEPYEKENQNKGSLLAFIVLHSDGQIIDGANEFSPLPEGAYFIEERKNIDRSSLPKFKEINTVRNHVTITHERSPFEAFDSSLYTTRITNRGTSAIKINRFSSYSERSWNKLRTRPVHSTIIGGWFNSNDFLFWYNQNAAWIQPKETVGDVRNYGSNCHWVYEIENEDGQVFWVSSYKE